MNKNKKRKHEKQMAQMKAGKLLVVALLLAATVWALFGLFMARNTLRKWDDSVLIRQESRCVQFDVIYSGRNARTVITLADETRLCVSDFFREAGLDEEQLKGKTLEFVYTKQTFRLAGDLLLVEIRQNGESLFPAALGREVIEEEAEVYGLLLWLLLPGWLLMGIVCIPPQMVTDLLKKKRKKS